MNVGSGGHINYGGRKGGSQMMLMLSDKDSVGWMSQQIIGRKHRMLLFVSQPTV